MTPSTDRKPLAESCSTVSTLSLTSLDSSFTGGGDLANASSTSRPLELASSGKSSLKIRRHSQSLRTEYRSQDSNDSRVGFHHLEVVEFLVVLGDHAVPTSGGPPLALSHQESARDFCTVDEYEETRKPRRSTMILKMTKSEREERLRHEGYDSSEFSKAAEEVERVQKLRTESANEPQSDLQRLMLESKTKKVEKQKAKPRGWRKILPARKAAVER